VVLDAPAPGRYSNPNWPNSHLFHDDEQHVGEWLPSVVLGVGFQLPLGRDIKFQGKWHFGPQGWRGDDRSSRIPSVDPNQVGIVFKTQDRDPSLDADRRTTRALVNGSAYRVTGNWTSAIIDGLENNGGPPWYSNSYDFQGYLVNQGDGSSSIYLYSTYPDGRMMTEFKGTVQADGFLSGIMTSYVAPFVDGEIYDFDPTYVPPLYAVETSESAYLQER
jgi:hypothetical protein